MTTTNGVTWSIDEYCSTKLNDDLLALNLNLNLNLNRGDDTNADVIIRDDDYWSIVLGKNDDDDNNKNNRQFLTELNLPAIHPFCINKSNFIEDNKESNNTIPPMGSLNFLNEIFKGTEEEVTGTGGSNNNTTTITDLFQAITTLWYLVAPTLLAMGELWLRLFAGLFGPIGIVYLVYTNSNTTTNNTKKSKSKSKPPKMSISFGIILTVSSTLILMTDTLYVLQNGPLYGILLFITSICLSIRLCLTYNLNITSVIVVLLCLLSIHLITTDDNGTSEIHFGSPIDTVRIKDGLYYNTNNKLVSKIVQNWVPKQLHVYDKDHDATSWMPTGDSRTGLPFILNKYSIDDEPDWVRVFLEVNGNDNDDGHDDDDDHDDHDDHDDDKSNKEYIAIDISFPSSNNMGHDWTKPIYFVLHGLHGGTNEEYIRDLTIRRNKEGSTVIVMIARGLMDTPIKGWNVFHGARTSDVHTAAKTIRNNVLEKHNAKNQNQKQQQILVGVGYSMGGIIMSNYVASYGADVQFDAAIAVSGGLDMRYQAHAYRTQRLWQPMLAGTLRSEFLLGKFGHRVKAKLTKYEFLQIMRATHITDIDRYAIVPLNGFDDVDHYYREMSALGDIPHDVDTDIIPMENTGKIHTVAIPLLVVQALDDPLITWRATIQNEGFMHPNNLVQSGSGNLLLLLTKEGGHVGWPLGVWPGTAKWKWISDVVMSFAQSVDEAKKNSKIMDRKEREKYTICLRINSSSNLAGRSLTFCLSKTLRSEAAAIK